MQPVIKQTHKAEKVKGRPGERQHLQKRRPFNKSRNVNGINKMCLNTIDDLWSQTRPIYKLGDIRWVRDVQLFHRVLQNSHFAEPDLNSSAPNWTLSCKMLNFDARTWKKTKGYQQ